jgi:hypothetical protein
MADTISNAPAAPGSATIESRDQFTGDTNKHGNYSYWRTELDASRRTLKDWHKQADRTHQEFMDSKRSKQTAEPLHTGARFKLNLFHSNVQTVQSNLYGRVPEVDVTRKNQDPNDDVGRVAAVIMKRLLANDATDYPEEYDSVLRATLEDRLVPGLGVARVRYDATFAASIQLVDGKVTQTKKLQTESAPMEYFHWRDVLWGWARTFTDIPWIAFRTYLRKEEAEKRFGAAQAKELNYEQRTATITDPKSEGVVDDPDRNDPWKTVEVWEIWDKEKRQVRWLADGAEKMLDSKPDPLKLRGFFPTPPFFIANATTTLYVPTPDFHFAQDIYHEVDKLQTRIAIITEAIRVVGVYDKNAEGVQRMMKEGADNDLIPVDSWAMLAEKGGLKGVIDWFPIEAVVNALVNLRQLRDESIQLLYQVTGMSDVMRGTLDNQYEGVGQTDAKVRFGSVVLQSLQEQYAGFVTNLMALKAEIISKHFDEETILRQSDIQDTGEDPQLIAQAVALVKDPPKARLQIEVKSEKLSLIDYQREQTERTNFLTAIATFMQSLAPMIQQSPASAPHWMQLLKWGLAGFRGADEIEGAVDSSTRIRCRCARQTCGRTSRPPAAPTR